MSKNKKERIQKIYQMLLEMGGGNFFYQLERLGENNDTIGAFELLLNMLAEEFQEAFSHQSYANSNGTMKHIVKVSFLINNEGIIEMINQNACATLSYLYKDIIQKPFDTFLTEDSKIKWQDTWEVIQQKGSFDTSLELVFRTKKKLLLPNSCYITTFKGRTPEERKTLITVIHHSNSERELEKTIKRNVIESKNNQELLKEVKGNSKKQKLKPNLSNEDIEKLRKAHDYISKNPEKDLPPLKSFALQLGTNDFKLKYGFKKLYGTGVHGFLINVRLRKAKTLVQYSHDLSIKSIAHMTGYKSSQHFSKSFKKKYKYSPSELRKHALKEKTMGL